MMIMVYCQAHKEWEGQNSSEYEETPMSLYRLNQIIFQRKLATMCPENLANRGLLCNAVGRWCAEWDNSIWEISPLTTTWSDSFKHFQFESNATKFLDVFQNAFTMLPLLSSVNLRRRRILFWFKLAAP